MHLQNCLRSHYRSDAFLYYQANSPWFFLVCTGSSFGSVKGARPMLFLYDYDASHEQQPPGKLLFEELTFCKLL